MGQRLDIRTAAGQLGLTPDAIRKRIERGTIQAERDKSGKWVVILSDNRPDSDRTATGQNRTNSDSIEVLREHIESLKKENARQQRTINYLQKNQEQTNYIIAMKEQKILQLEEPDRRSWWKKLFDKRKY